MTKKPKRVRTQSTTRAVSGSIDAPMAIDVLPLSVVRRNLRGILRHPRPIVVTRSGIALIVMRPIGSSDEAFDVTQRERP